jgi:hypothetical protein
MASWETVGGSMAAGLLNGGPAGIVYGMMFSTIGSVAVAASLAELASVYDGFHLFSNASLTRLNRCPGIPQQVLNIIGPII